jgi:mannose-6-phosphate isomerase-like protein (cupin superfamily)
MRISATIVTAVLLSGAPGLARAADPASPCDYVTASEVAAAVKAMDPARPAVNVLLKTVDEGDYTIAVVVVRRTPEPGTEDEGQSHDRITEIYQVVSGSGVMETGGSQPQTTSVDLRPAVGPTLRGTIVGGKTRAVGPGDTIVVLPHTPHRFSHLDGTIVYIALRIEAKSR